MIPQRASKILDLIQPHSESSTSVIAKQTENIKKKITKTISLSQISEFMKEKTKQVWKSASFYSSSEK